MIRAFLAFDIPKEVKNNLETFLEPIFRRSPGVKWVDPKNYHVTLKFFGNIDEEKMVPAISTIVAENVSAMKAVSLVCEEIGCFPSWQRPRVIWAGLKGETQTLIDLKKNLEVAFETLGFPKEDREFKLHLTLARIKSLSKERGWLENLEVAPVKTFGEVVVDHVTLYKSQLTKGGPVYTAVGEFRFPT